MKIDFLPLQYTFFHKSLLISGCAMEYYGRTFDYHYLKENAAEEAEYLGISLEILLFLKALAIEIPKYRRDLELIVQKLLDIAYGEERTKPK